ncbi:MAG: cytochrome c oxidase assembly protein [Acidimicrobiales bacterium]
MTPVTSAAGAMLAQAANPPAVISPPITLHQLLTGFQTDPLSLLATAVSFVVLCGYLGFRRRLQSRGRSWSDWRTASFAVGIVTIFVATGSGLASYDDSNFVLHVVQHLLLMNVAPILLALGAPVTLLLQSSERRATTRVLKVLHSRPVEALTHPVLVAVLAYVTMLVYFLTPIYTFAAAHPLVHDYVHLHFLLSGCLYWWPVVGLDPTRWRMSYPVRLGYLATGVPINAMIGIALTLNHASIDPRIHTLADTHAGGGVFWGISELILLAGIAVMYVQWSRWDDREAARADRRLDRELARSSGRGLAGGVIMDPTTGLWHYPADAPRPSRAPPP